MFLFLNFFINEGNFFVLKKSVKLRQDFNTSTQKIYEMALCEIYQHTYIKKNILVVYLAAFFKSLYSFLSQLSKGNYKKNQIVHEKISYKKIIESWKRSTLLPTKSMQYAEVKVLP